MNSIVARYINVQDDLVFVGNAYPDSRAGGGRRGDVSNFSLASKSRMGRYLRCCSARYRSMVTLTWPSDAAPDRDIAAQCFRRFIERLRRLWTTAGFIDWSAFWFREFTKVGTCHYHIFVTHWIPKSWLSHAWWEACGKISVQHLRAGTKIHQWCGGKKSISRYAAKYAGKSEQKEVPKNFVEEKTGQTSKVSAGRFWGIFGIRTQIQRTAVFKNVKNSRIFETNFSQRVENLISRLKNSSWCKKLETRCEFCDIYTVRKCLEFGEWWKRVVELEAEWKEVRSERIAIAFYS